MNKGLKNRAIALHLEGYSYDVISKKLRCAKSTISFHCSNLVKSKSKFTEAKIKEYQDYYDLGNNLKQTAERFGVSRQTLGNYLKVRKLSKLQSYQRANRRRWDYRNRVKAEAVKYKGGSCEICGYNRCIKALHFHHTDPKEKDFSISGGTKSFENLKSELDKCILVCANCHTEIHDNLHSDVYPCTDTA